MKIGLKILSLSTLWGGLLYGLCQSQSLIFHGSTVLIQPSKTTHHPADATYDSINFYCYLGPSGYFSFGWYIAQIAS
jgi:hypothetical protein